MRFCALIIIFTILASCAQRIKVPLNRMDSPEVIGVGMEMENQQIGFSSGSLNFENGNTNNPLLMSTVSERALHMGFGLIDLLDLYIQVPQESSSRIGLKIQLLGEGEKSKTTGNKLSMTLAMGSARDSYDIEYQINLKSNLTDYALIHGYRFNEYVMVYDGVSLCNYHFHGTINNPVGLSSGDITYNANNILGANAGVILGSTSFKLKLELAGQYITWTNTDTKLFYTFGSALTATW